jgi:hypothetical protein
MKLKPGSLATVIGILLLASTHAAECRTFTISWNPVTAYTDNSPISGVGVSYTIYWTADPALSPSSLKTVAASLPATSTVFDPEAIGMTAGQSVYFAAKAVLASGLESALSPAYSWVVPPLVAPLPPPVPPPPPPPSATLSGLSIGGPASVDGGGTGQFTATATLSDGTTQAATPAWNVSPSTYASIAATGLLTAKTVPSTQTATVGASYTLAGVTRTASRAVSIAYVAPALTGLSIGGPASVSGGGSGQFTATATLSDGTTKSATPAWSVSPSTYASIAATGLLTAKTVPSTQTVTVTASYTQAGVTRTASQAVTIANVAPTLSILSIAGPSSVAAGSTGSYVATAVLSDNTTLAVTPVWTVSPSTYASIGVSGVLATTIVPSVQSVTVSASYTLAGVTRTASRAVTIAYVSRSPATPVISAPPVKQ